MTNSHLLFGYILSLTLISACDNQSSTSGGSTRPELEQLSTQEAGQNEPQVFVPVEYIVTINVVNTPEDPIIRGLSVEDNQSATIEIANYFRKRLIDALNVASLPKNYTASAEISLSLGLEGKLEVDPNGNLLNVGGTAELKSPRRKALTRGARRDQQRRHRRGLRNCDRVD